MQATNKNNHDIMNNNTQEFDSSDYSYIIDEVCPVTKKSNQLVRQIIPILASWAKAGITDKTYGDLNKCLGYPDGRNRSINYQLGCVHSILSKLSECTGVDIPTPNCLLCSAQTGLPSDGFGFVKSAYSKMSKDEKRKFIRQVNSEVTNFKNWDWVLARLGLKTITPNDDEALIRKGGLRGYGGESEAHKQLKEYIAAHPKTVGANEVGTTEHILLSADRLDVWFPKSRIAVEVKPKSAVDADILRGLFQCIKYKAVLDAESAVHGELADSKVILVMEGSLSPSNIEIMQTLGVDVIQNFKHKA